MDLVRVTNVLRFNALGIALIALQAALACAVTSIAVGFVLERADKVVLDIGITEERLGLFSATDLGTAEERAERRKSSIAEMEQMPAVRRAASMSHLPLGGRDSSFGVCASPEVFERAVALGSIEIPGCAMPSAYTGSPGMLETLGLPIVQGRAFEQMDFGTKQPQTAILTTSLSTHLFGMDPAVGKTIQAGPDTLLQVIGLVADVSRPHPTGGLDDRHVIFLPSWPNEASTFYAVKVQPAYDAEHTTTEALQVVARASHRVIVDREQALTLSDLRRRYFSRDYSLMEILAALVTTLLAVTAAGCFAVTWLWVAKRRRSIGVRRAIGAKARDIVRMILGENMIIVLPSALAGVVAARIARESLFELSLPFSVEAAAVSISLVLVVLVGQLAALLPALRAARVPPAIATRSE